MDPNLYGSWTSAELGYAKAPPPPPGDLPPGGGHWTVPPFMGFQSLVTTAARSWLWTSDEALRNSHENALAMRRDAFLYGLLRARQRPTTQLEWHLDPADETNPAEVEAAQLVTEIMEAIPRFQAMNLQLLEAIWYGKYAVELGWEWKQLHGRTCLMVRDFAPVNGDKIRYKWDGTPGFLVYASYPGPKEATDWGLCHFLTPGEREQYVIHNFEPDDQDWTEPQLGGGIWGVGLRGRLYWFWYLKQQCFALLMNYLQRFSNGLTLIYYQAGNPQAEANAQSVASSADNFAQTAILIPRWNSEHPDVNKVERLEVGTASPTLLWNVVGEYFDPIMKEAVLGQSGSSEGVSGGLGGSGVAALHGETLDEIIKYDATNLQDTLQADLVDVLYKYNCPGVRPGRFKFEIEAPDSEAILGYAQALFEMGMELDGDQLLELAQLQKPKPGATVVSKLGSLEPTAVGGVPAGVPVAGAVGPQGDPSQMAPGQPPPAGGEPALAYRRNGRALKKRRLTRV